MEAIFKPNGMRPLLNIADMQNAPVQMQPPTFMHHIRLCMGCISLRQLLRMVKMQF